ncbi:hypothetical protein GCK72_021624 [Caenorhabditis remanei]|uniref:BTB domain-containing protein n=1 Tax=Caenorhabditis remanei TaxID=31234 RepID=A0A6A5GKC5_CAERE|nr:hypothetical protein GCK72_021624 [Caenorhabditis remanei]KAF1755056.1 hypothetical protein GCK72_021624 [Caenorhabditis remanei]
MYLRVAIYPRGVKVDLKPPEYQGLYSTAYQISSVAGFYDCQFKVYMSRHGDSCVASATIQLGGSKQAIIRTRCCVEVVNRDEEKSEIFEKECAFELGKEYFLMDGFTLLNIFDEEDGWINNGKLMIKFGIYAYAIYEQNIWFFNFNDSIFDAKDINQTIFLAKRDSDEKLECNKQLLVFHSSRFAKCLPNMNSIRKFSPDVDMNTLNVCIQMAHGVQMRCDVSTLDHVIQIAHYLKLRNVQIYCERQLIHEYSHLKVTSKMILFAFRHDLYRYLYLNLQKYESFKDFQAVLKKADIQMMSTESMKLCIKSFVENEKWE